MTSLPVRKYHHSRPLLTDHACHFKTVLPCVFHATVGYIERITPGNLQDLGCFNCFLLALIGGPTCPHLSASQIQNARAMALLRHLEHGSTTGLLYVVTVRSDGQDFDGHGRNSLQAPKLSIFLLY